MAWEFIKRLFQRQVVLKQLDKQMFGPAPPAWVRDAMREQYKPQLISRYPDPPRADPTRVPTHECYVCGHPRAFVFCGACGAQQQKFQRGRSVIVPDAWAGEMLKNM